MAPSARRGFWLFVSVLATFAAAKAVLFDTIDPDCFWHLRVADQLCRQGIGPVVDDLSFASIRTPWTPYSWLAELGMKVVWDAGGFRAAVAVQAAVQGAIVLMLGLICASTGRCLVSSEHGEMGPKNPTAAALAVAAGTFLMLPYLSFRPVTFGFLILLTIAWLLARGGRGVWWAVPLTAVYANIHLFVFFVPLMVSLSTINAAARVRRRFKHSITGANGTGKALPWDRPAPVISTAAPLRSHAETQSGHKGTRSLYDRFGFWFLGPGGTEKGETRGSGAALGLVLATTVAAVCTPMLPGLLRSVWNYSTRDPMVAGPVIAEMHGLAHGTGSIPAVAVVVGMIGCAIFGRRKLTPGRLMLIGLTAALSFHLGRFVPLFVIVTAPAVAVTFGGFSDRVLGRPAVGLGMASVLLLIAVKTVAGFPGPKATLSDWVNRHGDGTPGYPCAAADFVDSAVARNTGNLINEFSWGGYLGWRLGPRYQVLLDGRTQVFAPDFWRATYLGTDDDRARFLSAVKADAAVLPTGHSEFRPALVELGWTSVYRDDRAEVLIPPRRPGTGFVRRAATGDTYASWR